MKPPTKTWIQLLGIAAGLASFRPAAAAVAVEAGKGAYPVAPVLTPLPADENFFGPRVSADGRLLVFHTRSATLISADNNGLDDVYLLDRATRQYIRVSVAIGGGDPDGSSVGADISLDGRVVAFHSTAANLVSQDLNGRNDVFVHDLGSGVIERISISSAGQEGNGNSSNARLSADGRFVVFASSADNLVVGDGNQVTDIFVRDRQSAQTFRVSLASDGAEGDAVSLLPTVSANGRYVAFHSEATNFSDNEFDVLTDIFLHDRVTAETQLINVSSAGVRSNADSARGEISADGRAVAFYSRAPTLEPGRENVHIDIFVRDTLTGQTELASPGLAGEPSDGSSFNPVLSADGHRVAYHSGATNLVPGDGNALSDVFVFDRGSQTTSLVSAGPLGEAANGGSFLSVLAAGDGEVLFESQATNLDALGGDKVSLFARHPGVADAVRLSLAADLTVLPNAPVDGLDLSANRRFVGFETTASNLWAGDSNGLRDVFVYDRRGATVEAISGDQAGLPVTGPEAGDSTLGGLSADGCVVAFSSQADGDALGNGALLDDNAGADVYLRDRCAGNALRVISASLDGIRHANGPSDQIGIAGDGTRGVFASAASDLTAAGTSPGVSQVYLFDADSGVPTLVSAVGGTPGSATSDGPVISEDGEYVAFVSRDPALDPLVPLIERPAPGDAAVYRYRVASGQIELISRGVNPGWALVSPLGDSEQAAISADGSAIAFASTATNLTTTGAGGIIQVYAWREGGAEPNRIVALLPPGGVLSGASERPAISPDGRFVVFQSEDAGWVPDDTNGRADVIAYDIDSGNVTLVSRADDGTAATDGDSTLPAVAASGRELDVGFISSAAISQGGAIAGGLYLGSLPIPTPELTIDGFVDSPLQSVQSDAIRLQVRNTGNVTLSSADGIVLEFPNLQHALAVGDPPRWQCQQLPLLTCSFVGDALLGDQILPYAAERLDFAFDMFPGSAAIVSEARLKADFLAPGAEPGLTLTTERVQRGVVWEASASAELNTGDPGMVAFSITNGGLEAVSTLHIEVSALRAGETAHPLAGAGAGDWQCGPAPPPADPDDPNPPYWVCDYSGSPLAPGAVTGLQLLFTLPPAVIRLVSVAGLSADVDVIAPNALKLLETAVAGLIFLNGFEG